MINKSKQIGLKQILTISNTSQEHSPGNRRISQSKDIYFHSTIKTHYLIQSMDIATSAVNLHCSWFDVECKSDSKF